MPWWTSSLQTDLNVLHGSATNGDAGRTRAFLAPDVRLARMGRPVRVGCPAVRGAMDAGDGWGRRGHVKRNMTIRVVPGPPIGPEGPRPPEPNPMAAKRVHDGCACARRAGGDALASS